MCQRNQVFAWRNEFIVSFLNTGNVIRKKIYKGKSLDIVQSTPNVRNLIHIGHILCVALHKNERIRRTRQLRGAEKLTGFQLVKKFPASYRNRMFITALTSAHHLSLPYDTSIDSMPSHTVFWICILILFSYLRLDIPSGPFPSGLPTKTL